MVFKTGVQVGAGNRAVMETPGNRPEDRRPGTHRNESPAGYSWRVALLQWDTRLVVWTIRKGTVVGLR